MKIPTPLISKAGINAAQRLRNWHCYTANAGVNPTFGRGYLRTERHRKNSGLGIFVNFGWWTICPCSCEIIIVWKK